MAQFLVFTGLILACLFAIASRVIWGQTWFPPPAHWSRRRKAVVWIIFLVGTAAIVFFGWTISQIEPGP